MRNTKGGLGEFEEVCPGHMPHLHDGPRSLQAFAFSGGYIKAPGQAVNSEL